MNAYVKDIRYHLPAAVVTNRQLGEENPGWSIDTLQEKTGVAQRHIAAVDETALDLAMHACEKLFAAQPALKESIDGLIFCTQSPDYIMPPNSSVLHGRLGLKEGVLAYDFNLACSGYVYGLAMAQAFIKAGMLSNILLVTADTYSKYIHPGDRATRFLFGDGASASWIAAAPPDGRGVVDLVCATHGADHEKFIIRAGAHRQPRNAETAREATDTHGNVRSPEHIFMDGLGVLNFAKIKVAPLVRQLLERNRLSFTDIDLVIFHQASKMAMDTLVKVLKVPPEKAYSNIGNVGNLVSTSIPAALRDALDDGAVAPGQRVLLVGFGVGLSTAVALLDI